MILGLVILGPEKLPGVIRKAGKLYGEFKRITTDAQSEFNGAFGDTIGELKQTAQGYKSMFDSASQQANNTLISTLKADASMPTLHKDGISWHITADQTLCLLVIFIDTSFLLFDNTIF